MSSHEAKLRKALQRAITTNADSFPMQEVTRLMADGKIEAAARLCNIDPATLNSVKDITEQAINSSGRDTVNSIPSTTGPSGQQIKTLFNPGSKRAVAAVDTLHSNLIRDVTSESREAVMDHIRDGLSQGKNPRSIARQIRGPYNPVTRSHDASVIGLTKAQNQWVLNAEHQLRSGNPTEMRKYLGRQLRDKRHDRAVLRAINEGTPLSEAQIEAMSGSYRRKALQYRTETIARDQALSATTKGQDVALDQAVEEGVIKDQDILQFWLVASDGRERPAHAAIPSMNAEGVRRGEYFQTPHGPLLHPRDRNSAGSVPENVIQCRCSLSIRVRRQPVESVEDKRGTYETPKEPPAPKKKPPAKKFQEGDMEFRPTNDLKELKSQFKTKYNVTSLEGVSKADPDSIRMINLTGDAIGNQILARFPKLRERMEKLPTKRSKLKTLAMDDRPPGSPLKGINKPNVAGYYWPKHTGSEIRIGRVAMRKLDDQLRIGGLVHNTGGDFRSIVRHEYGHLVHGQTLHAAQSKRWDRIFENMPKLTIEETVSRYAATNKYELFAESFQAYTSPLYGKPGYSLLPKPIHDFFHDLIGRPG